MLDAHQLGSRIARFCRSSESYLVLDSTDSRGATWTSGGCGLLALALKELMPAGTVRAVLSAGQAEHVVFLMGDTLIDADGAVPSGEFLAVWCAREHFTPPVELGAWDVASEESIPHSAADVARVTEGLRRVFPVAQPTRLGIPFRQAAREHKDS